MRKAYIFQSGIKLSKLNMMVSSCICFPEKDMILFFVCMCVCLYVHICVCAFMCACEHTHLFIPYFLYSSADGFVL